MLALVRDHSPSCSCLRVFDPMAKMKMSLNDGENAALYASRAMSMAGMLPSG